MNRTYLRGGGGDGGVRVTQSLLFFSSKLSLDPGSSSKQDSKEHDASQEDGGAIKLHGC